MKEQIRNQFDFLKNNNIIYFDNSASSLLPKTVCEAVDYYNRFESVNAGRGIYTLAYSVTLKVEKARQKVAQFLGAQPSEIIFTKNTTEGINIVALSYVMENLKSQDEIVISGSEHNSNYLPWLNLAKKMDLKLKIVPLKNFKIETDDFKKAITNKTKFVAFNLVCNTLGYKIDAKEIINYAKKMGAKVLVDASQAISHFKIDVKTLDCDFLTFSSYKVFAPSGSGVLYCKSEILNNMKPIFYGGGMVLELENENIIAKEAPYKFEAGTLPVGNIIGLYEALNFTTEIGWEYIENAEKDLKNYLLKKMNGISEAIIYNKNPDLPIIIFNLLNLHPHDVATLYDKYNICVRAGNHCGILVEKLIAQPSLRVSLSFYNTFEEIDKFIATTEEIIGFFKRLDKKGENNA